MIKDKKNVNKPKTNGVNGTSKPIWSTNNSRKMGGSTKTFSSRSDTPSSILSSDSDIRFTRKFSRNVRGPCCVLATFLVALLVAGIMYYLGYRKHAEFNYTKKKKTKKKKLKKKEKNKNNEKKKKNKKNKKKNKEKQKNNKRSRKKKKKNENKN
ncbi:hypothetical protein M8J76_008555 [Diaphorina citri]|nr:hypothetical protein M8J76_008555 [Diaphorina citri]